MAASDPLTREYSVDIFPSIGEELYLKEDFADFHFLFGSDRVPVHKMILATASDVFRAMFSGAYIEKTEVEIVDASADAFKEFLAFIYLRKAKVTMANVAEVMNLGKKYDIVKCFNICGEFLIENLTYGNVIWIHESVGHLGHEKLKEVSKRCIDLETSSVLASDDFLRCDRKTVKLILQIDDLCANEVEVFEALMKWIKVEVGQEELTHEIFQGRFSDLVHEIRFGSMTLNKFCSFDSSYGALFTREETREIIQMINSMQFRPKIFKENRRNNFGSIQWNENAVIECNRSLGYAIQAKYIKNIETTTFSINKLVLLGGFSYPSVCNSSGSYSYEMTIIESSDLADPNANAILYTEKINVKTGNGTKKINLSKPILIRVGFKYQIEIKGLASHLYTNERLKMEVKIEPDIHVQFYDDPNTNNGSSRLIAALELNRVN